MTDKLYKRAFIHPFYSIVGILIVVDVLIFLIEEAPGLSIPWKIPGLLLLALGVFVLRIFIHILFHFFGNR
jgi:hypothetical protein